MRYRYWPALSLLILASGLHSQSRAQLPPEITAVQNYVLKEDYPELINNQPYRVKVENATVADLDGDGQPEVVLHTTPHYRQSATLLIYKVAKDLSVSRVIEGLAPGPLVAVSGDHLDSHVEKVAADFIARSKDGVDIAKAVREAMLSKKSFDGIVEYKKFFHADKRNNRTYYVDMREHDIDEENCEKFEFSKVLQISTGTVDGLSKNPLLAAWVGEKIYFYQIYGVDHLGLLKKKVMIADTPPNFTGFTVGISTLSYNSSVRNGIPVHIICRQQNSNECILQ